MKTTYAIIGLGASKAAHECELPERPSFDELKKLLGPIFHAQRAGAHFEHVSVLGDDGSAADMFVDDLGAFSLPVNIAATRVYHRARIKSGARHFDGLIAGAPSIHGLAIIFDRRVWF